MTAASTVQLQTCVGPQCLEQDPQLSIGQQAGVGGSGSIFVDNAAWRIWAAETYNVSVLEMESGAFAQVAITFGMPYIVIRSVSDLAGGDPQNNKADTFVDIAATNAALVAEELVRTAPADLS